MGNSSGILGGFDRLLNFFHPSIQMCGQVFNYSVFTVMHQLLSLH